MPRGKSITARDVEIGDRIRLRRKEIGMSQGKLGDALDLTFQQVQKYEKGTNRIGAGRLEQISRILGVPMGYFYDDVRTVDGLKPLQFLNAPGVVKLAKAYTEIKDQKLRLALIAMAEAMAEGRHK